MSTEFETTMRYVAGLHYDELFELLQDCVELYREHRDKRGYDEHMAIIAAVVKTIEGIEFTEDIR